MAGEAIKDIGRLVRRRRDHVDVVRRALIGIVRVEADAMTDAVAGVDVAAGCASLRAPEKLSIAAGRGAVAPDPREGHEGFNKAGPMERNVARPEDFTSTLRTEER